MATRAAVQTPGEAPATNPAAAAPAASVEELQAMVAAQAAQMAQLMGMVGSLQANQRAVPAQAAAEALPSMGEIDLASVRAGAVPVLTRDGWVVPDNFGADPKAMEAAAREEQKTDALVKLAEAVAAKV